MKLSQSPDNSNAWLDRAEEAYAEFCKKDASQMTESQLWEETARQYDLPEDLGEFTVMRERLSRRELSLDRAEIEKNPTDFLKLKRAWKSFLNKYQPKIKTGESRELWKVFCSAPNADEWRGLKDEKRLVWDRIKKNEVKEIVEKFGLLELGDYQELLRDSVFMESLRVKAGFERTINLK